MPPSDTVTVEPSGAVPVEVTNSLEFATPVLMTGAAGGSGSGGGSATVISKALDAALVPADVVSVAVKARAGRQVRRGEAPGPGAARGRDAKRASAAIRHRHRGTVRCGSRQGHNSLEFATPVLIPARQAAADPQSHERAGRCAGPRRRRIGRGEG